MKDLKLFTRTRQSQPVENHFEANPGVHTRYIFSRKTSFWILATLLGFLLFAASAPSPLYVIYEAMWHFSAPTLTAIYAIYALAALMATLTTGRLSDYLGRKPVLMLALIVQIAGMAAFINAQGVGWLFAARFLQGLGTGIASGAISAWLIDLQPADNPRIGSIIGGIALLAGLGAGAFISGMLVQYGPDPLRLIYWILAGIYILSFAAMIAIPDLVTPKPGWLRSLNPEIGVPPSARSLFAASFPSLIAIWALGGLYLALGPSLAITLLRTNSHIAGGLVIVALMGGGALAAILVRAADPNEIVARGSFILIIGVGITLLAVLIGSSLGLYIGSLVAGIGFGPAFSGIFRSLAPLAPPDKRSALLAAIYLIVYLAFGVPIVVAGVAVMRFGLRDTTYGYGLVVMILATITTIAVSRRRRALILS